MIKNHCNHNSIQIYAVPNEKNIYSKVMTLYQDSAHNISEPAAVYDNIVTSELY